MIKQFSHCGLKIVSEININTDKRDCKLGLHMRNCVLFLLKSFISKKIPLYSLKKPLQFPTLHGTHSMLPHFSCSPKGGR